MNFHVIDKKKKFVVSEHSDRALCEEYIRTCRDLWGHDPSNYIIAEGSKDLKTKLKELNK